MYTLIHACTVLLLFRFKNESNNSILNLLLREGGDLRYYYYHLTQIHTEMS